MPAPPNRRRTFWKRRPAAAARTGRRGSGRWPRGGARAGMRGGASREAAFDSPLAIRRRLSGAMAPPPPAPSMAPPGLIHSAPGLLDTCALPQPPAAATMSGPAAETPSAIQICRIMRPDDANVAGNVHGGTVLKMIEEAGAIISTRHCNSQNGERCVAALARVERTDFLSPMCIGEVAHVSAEITYTSKHSVEVQVHVMSENILTGTKKLTNKATLWYVPLSLKNVDKVLEVPPVVYSRQEQEEEGRKRYEAQKLERMETKWRSGDIVQPVLNPEPNTVSYSQSSLIHLVGPSDCTLHGFVHGGVTMKLMDEVAGIVAARHCKTNIVTASVDAINFHDKIRKGCVITISGRMTFTSNKSMEIEVLVDADPVVNNFVKRYRAASAFFTYVSLSPEGKSLPVPQLVLQAAYLPCSCYHLPDCTVSEQMLEQNHIRCLSHLDGSAALWCPGHGQVRPSRLPLFLKSPTQSCLRVFALAVPLPGHFPPVIMMSALAIVSQIIPPSMIFPPLSG